MQVAFFTRAELSYFWPSNMMPISVTAKQTVSAKQKHKRQIFLKCFKKKLNVQIQDVSQYRLAYTLIQKNTHTQNMINIIHPVCNTINLSI